MQPYIEYSLTFIRLKNVNEDIRKKVSFSSAEKVGKDEYIFRYSTDEEKINLFSLFRDIGIAFSIGKDWSPADEFEYYREKGYLCGKFLKILWKTPREYVLIES